MWKRDFVDRECDSFGARIFIVNKRNEQFEQAFCIATTVVGCVLLYLLMQYFMPHQIVLINIAVAICVFSILLAAVALFGILLACSTSWRKSILWYLIPLMAMIIALSVCSLSTIAPMISIRADAESDLVIYFSSSWAKPNYASLIDRLQMKLHCCGVFGPNDYAYGHIPSSCPPADRTNVPGCAVKLANKIELLGGIMIGLGLLSCLTAIVSGILTFFYRFVWNDQSLAI